MSWEKVEIGDLVTLRQGFAINKKTKHHMSDEPTKLHLLRIGDMKEGNFSVYVKDTIPEKFIAKEDDIIYTRTGQVGLVFRRQYGVVHNNCFTVSSNDNKILMQEFLFYTLQEKSFYEEAVSRATGAAQPDLPHGAFNSIKIFLPPIEIQKKIINYLDNLNNLIDNNKKQIKLLEEAIQRFYKEWFVDFHFPGYEDIEFEDGHPKGWALKALSLVATLKAGGDKPKVFSKEFSDKCSIPVYSNGTENEGLYGYTNEAKITDNSITISARGSVGYTCLRRKPYVPIVRLISVIPTEIDVEYLYMYLKNYKFQSNGAAQQQITVPMIKDKEVLIPSGEVLNAYRQNVLPMFDEIDNLKRQNQILTEVRDRLISKLMTGEIEVKL